MGIKRKLGKSQRERQKDNPPPTPKRRPPIQAATENTKNRFAEIMANETVGFVGQR